MMGIAKIAEIAKESKIEKAKPLIIEFGNSLSVIFGIFGKLPFLNRSCN
jgi:hypothetical protein